MSTTATAAGTAQGFVDEGFEPVRRAFEENLASRGEIGAAVCVYLDGRPVVDLWGGLADTKSNRPWERDTLGLIFSATKGITAICALLLSDEGKLDLAAPVAEYWPEFAAAGKERITVEDVLSHQAGLPGFTRLMSIADMEAYQPLVDDLAVQMPAWEPRSAHGYHAYTFGWLVGEVIRRITGSTPGEYLRERICGPLDLDLWFGLPEAERDRYARVEQTFESRKGDLGGYELVWSELAKLAGPGALTGLGQRLSAAMLRGPARPMIEKSTARALERKQISNTQRAFLSLLVTIDDLNSDRLLNVEFPAGNGICTARSLAKLYATLVGEVDGTRLLRPETVERAATPLASGTDRVLGSWSSYGLGFMLPGTMQFDGWGRHMFGHPGNGGALGFADIDSNLSFGYVLKRITPLSRSVRSDALVRAVYECL